MLSYANLLISAEEIIIFISLSLSLLNVYQKLRKKKSSLGTHVWRTSSLLVKIRTIARYVDLADCFVCQFFTWQNFLSLSVLACVVFPMTHERLEF